MSKYGVVFHEFIDKLSGGDEDINKKLYQKSVDSLIRSGKLKERSVVKDEKSENEFGIPINYKTGEYPSSKYLEKFIGSVDNTSKKTIKEDFYMRRRRKSVMTTFLEDLENSRGLVGLGDDDDVVGAPGFDPDATIAGGIDNLSDVGLSLDDDLDTVSSQEHLFGDDRLKGDKQTMATEATYVRTKRDYKRAVNALFYNLAELSILSYLPANRYGKQEHKIVVESMFRAITSSKKPVLWESLSHDSRTAIAKKVAYFQSRRNFMMSRPTKRNAAIVEAYLAHTNSLLREIDQSLSAGGMSVNPTDAPMAHSAPNSSAISVATTFGAAMGALKSKISQCNENPDLVMRANCQVAAYNEALGLVRGLIAVCSDDELCKSKVMRAIGRLEVMRSNAEKAEQSSQPIVQPEPPLNPTQGLENPGQPAPGELGLNPGQQSLNPGMNPHQMMPAVPNQMPTDPSQMQQVSQEFYDLTKGYNVSRLL